MQLAILVLVEIRGTFLRPWVSLAREALLVKVKSQLPPLANDDLGALVDVLLACPTGPPVPAGHTRTYSPIVHYKI